MKRFFILFIVFFKFHYVFGQDQTHSVYYAHTELTKVINNIEQQYQVHFSYQSDILKNLFFTCPKQELSLDALLQKISKTFKLKFIKLQKGFYVILLASADVTKQDLKEVIINAFLTDGIKKNKDGSFTVYPQDLGILAGLIAPDVVESIQQLPGVISLNETATNLSIRGGRYDQNLIYYDGIPIYQNGHLFGMISPFNPYTVKRVKYYFKGTPPRYEGGASGVIDLSSGDNIAEKLHVGGGINALSTDFELETPLIKKHLSLTTSFRTSYRDVWETSGLKQFEKKIFENTNIQSQTVKLNTFGFNDWTIKLNSQWAKRQKLSVSFLHISSFLNFNHKISGYDDYDYGNNLDTSTSGVSITSNNILNGKWQVKTVFDWAWYDMAFENQMIKLQKNIGNVFKENFVSHTGITTEFSYRPNYHVGYRFGYDYNEKRTAYLFKLIVDNQLYIFDYLKNINNTQSVFGMIQYRNFHNWDIDAGFRIPYYQEFQNVFFEPRLVIGKKILPHTKLQITGEIKHQNIQQNNKTVIGLLNLENKIWQVAEPVNFPFISVRQITSGLLFLKNQWHLELDFYHKYTKNVSISVPYRIYNKHQYLIGDSQTQGFDFYTKKKYRNFNFWASYSLMRSQNRFEKLKNNQYFISDFQIRHKTLSTIIYHKKQYQMAISWLWHSPRPYYKNIIVDDENEYTGNNIKQDFDIAYLPPFNRVDFSAFYNYQFENQNQNKLKLKFGFSVRNLLNHQNILSHEQNGYGLDTQLIDFERYGLNRVFNIVLRLNWD